MPRGSPMLADRTDVSSEPVSTSEDARSPQGYLVVALDEAQRTELEGWLELHLRQIEGEMAAVLARFEQERNQLEGRMPGGTHPYAGAFRMNYPVTKRKVRQLANRLKQAYLDNDPIWAVSSDLDELEPYAQDVEKALDRAVDNLLAVDDDLAQACFEAVLHGAGFLEPGWAYHEERVRQLERWQGFDGITGQSLRDLVRFEEQYANWREEPELRRLHSQVARGHDVEREVASTVATVNHPVLRFVDAHRIRVYPSVEGFEGLRDTPAYGYVQTYTRFQLEALAADGTIDAEQLASLFSAQRDDEDDARAQQEPVDIWHATVRRNLDGEVARYKVWYAVKERRVLRCRAWPWWYWEPDLIPVYVRVEEPGFFKRGLAWDLVDDHEALNVLLNLFLNAGDMANALRLKAKEGSLAERYLLSGRYSPRLPVPYESNPNEVDTLDYPTGHLTPLLEGFELMRRQADESTSTTVLQTGRESPTDPDAPGIKTAMLLKQAEPDLKEYLRSAEPGFRQAGRWLVWLYHQGIGMGWIDGLPGLGTLPPEVLPLVAEHLQPRSVLFEFDRAGQQQRDLAMVQLFAKLFPFEIDKAFRVLLSRWDSTWSRMADSFKLQPPQPQGPEAVAPTPMASPETLRTSSAPPTNGNASPAARPGALAGLLA